MSHPTDTPTTDAPSPFHPTASVSTFFLWSSFLLVLTGVLVSTSYIIFYENYKNTMYPGVSVAGQRVTGKTSEQVLTLLNIPVRTFEEEGIPYSFQDYKVFVNPTLSSESDSFAYDFITFDTQKTVEAAYRLGREGSFLNRITAQFLLLTRGHDVPVYYAMDEKKLAEILQENFSSFEVPAKNASLFFKSGKATLVPEETGTTFDYAKIVSLTHSHLSSLNTKVIILTSIVDKPNITLQNATSLLDDAEAFVKRAPFQLTYKNKKWSIDSKQAEKIITLDKTSLGTVTLSVVSSGMKTYLQKIDNEIHVAAKEGKFELQNGELVQIQTGQNGIALNTDTSILVANTDFVDKHLNTTQLVVSETQPKFTAETAANLRIKEKIGEGISNFAGSPTNRIKNIRHGATKIHGLLIAPDETFSLIAALQPFTLADGWFEELVIKGNRTIPEVGGGGCQLGTTLFRAAMGTGLPIVARQNHSYAVSYYFEQGVPGTDATIYDPNPDFRFRNDTGNYILLQTRIEGTQLIFDMWGTSDGRVASRTKPVVSNYVPAPPKKEIETTDLKPGEVKCVEKPHTGMTASFDYFVKYADGREVKENFTSKYKPWQEVCLIGVDPNKKNEDAANDTPSSGNTNTNPTANTNTNATANKNSNSR